MLSVHVLRKLFPRLGGVAVEDLVDGDGAVRIEARVRGDASVCPSCGVRSGRVHDRYRRRIADQAVGGQPVVIHLTVRRFRCDTASCPRRTFAEQVPGLTFRYGRRSVQLRETLQTIGLALAGRAGACLARSLNCAVSPNTLLNLVRALPDTAAERSPRVLGVDDFALKLGHVYVTILIDIETGRPVDVLPDRTARTLSAWLDRHPGTEVVCRDRASSYAEAVRTSAPDAIQVADRFHVRQNLTDAVERCVIAHRSCLPAAGAADTEPSPEPERPREGKYVINTHQRQAAVHELQDKGVGTTRISQILGMDPKTVRRYARTATADELIVPPRSQDSPLRRFHSYLNERWNEGCIDSTRLYEEIRALGYKGTDRTARRWLEPLRSSAAPAPKVSDVPSTRKVTGWITRHPENLTSDEALRLKHLLAPRSASWRPCAASQAISAKTSLPSPPASPSNGTAALSKDT
ncbi:ISL3 family transposase [Streptomyces roseoverticillatus]